MATKSSSSSSANNNNNKDEILPHSFTVNFWVRLYRAVPPVNVPGTELTMSFSLLGAAFLYAVRISLRHVLVRFFDWPDEVARESVGSLAAIVHSLMLLPGLFVALTSQPYQPTAHLSTSPLWWQDLVTALLQFCTGYMIYDSIASFFMIKGFGGLDGTDFLFLGHHLATTIYMTQCRYLSAGHISAMICMLLGESLSVGG